MLSAIVSALALIFAVVLLLRPARWGAISRVRPGWLGTLALVSAFALGFQVSPPNAYWDAVVGRVAHHRLPDYLRSFEPEGDPARIEPLLAGVGSVPCPTGDPDAAHAWRSRVIAELRASLDFDGSGSAVPVDLDILHHEVLPDGVRREFCRFESFDGTSIPAFLLQPVEATGPRPAILVIPGHGRGIRGAAGLLDDYQNHSALELARAGYVVLVPELRGFGLLGPEIGLDHRVVATNALRAGESYKGVVARDLQRALSALTGIAGVDADRVGVAGASMGGELALLIALLDDRVAATAVNSHGMHVGPVSDAAALSRFARRHGCHILPAGAPRLFMEDWYRLMVPRPLLVVDGESDLRAGKSRLPDRVEHFEAAVRAAYDLEDAASLVTITITPGAHEFFVGPTRDFFHQHLGEPDPGSRPLAAASRRAGF